MELLTMRVLFTCVAATGHFHPLVPVARALTEAGHEVAFATHASLAPLVERAGFRHWPAGLGVSSPGVAALLTEMSRLPRSEQKAFAARRIFAGVLAAPMAADLLAVLAEWPADLLVRETTEFAGCVLAERLDLPHAAVSVLAAGIHPKLRDSIAEPLDALRADYGLPPDPELRMLDRYLTLHPFPLSLIDSASARPAAGTHFFRPVLFDRSGDEELPAWVGELPERPTVYATLGTAFNSRADIFAVFLAGLRDEPLNLIVTVGRDQDPTQFGPQPAHVRIERYIPQTLLLPRCHLVLTHGGSGTVMTALAHGLPLVVTPISADQPENAARCAALGLGRALDEADLTPDAVREAVRMVLANPVYRRNAERLREEIRSLPGPEHAVALLERLVVERRPLTAVA
jgi:UDP:flavonoid glycosyltransferase YjiC (YdhE family)